MAPVEVARRNELLNGLSSVALTSLAAELQLRAMHVRDGVNDPHADIEEVFFPIDCVLSTVAHDADGDVVEVATIGNEGMAGIAVFLGVNSSPTLQTFTQVPGNALVMRARDFRHHLKTHLRLSQIMGLYTQALLTQISQASACNRMHPAEERCARWLLMAHDRVQRDVFELTQQFLAAMLGVRRATVSGIAGGLQDANVIRYVRGVITVTNRPGLEAHSCECYRIIRDEYARLLRPLREEHLYPLESRGRRSGGGSAPD